MFQNIKYAPEEFLLLLRKKPSTEAENTLFNKQKRRRETKGKTVFIIVNCLKYHLGNGKRKA